MKCIFLSYPLSSVIPVYGGPVSVDITQIKSIAGGDSSNVFSFVLQNHWGTHVDCPAHFFQNGKKATAFSADFWLFIKPQIIAVKVDPGQIISKDDLEDNIRPDTDLLILKSGWGKFRGDPMYYLKNPGIDPDLGLLLRKQYPSIRAFAIDWISLSSYEHRQIGRDAHKVFLNPSAEGNPIVIVEDIHLPDDVEELSTVCVAPIQIEGIDSAPCTIIGFL
jgi:arylformamidase